MKGRKFESRPTRTIGYTLSRGAAWATVLIFAAGLCSMIWLDRQIGMSPSLSDVMLMISFGVFAVVGALLVTQRPGNPVSWIMLAIGLIVGIFPTLETYAAYVMITRGSPNPLAVFGAWANALYWIPLLSLALIYLPLLFPDGRLPSRRWLPVAVIAGLAVAGFVVIGAFSETLTGQDIDYYIANPIGIKGMPPIEQHPIFPVLIIGVSIGLLGAAAAVFVRFRRSRGVERQQLKWFLFAAALTPAIMFTDRLALVGEILFGLVLMSLPAAVGIAVLRYRLYDIDIIIRRTLAYGLLTAILALVYFGIVSVLQNLIIVMSGLHSAIATVLSTLAIAALFSPLRRRIQESIDRVFYRRRYDAEQTLQDFAIKVRDEVELEQLIQHLVSVVQETMQPASISLMQKEPGKRPRP
jgi:hypothetical protein